MVREGFTRKPYLFLEVNFWHKKGKSHSLVATKQTKQTFTNECKNTHGNNIGQYA